MPRSFPIGEAVRLAEVTYSKRLQMRKFIPPFTLDEALLAMRFERRLESFHGWRFVAKTLSCSLESDWYSCVVRCRVMTDFQTCIFPSVMIIR